MPPSPTSLNSFLRPLARSRWVWVLFGLVCLALGAAALAGSDLGVSVIAALFGGYLLVTGLLDGLAGLTDPHADPGRRASAIVLAAVAMIAGLLCLRHPGQDVAALVLATGIYLIVAGAVYFAGAVDEEQPQIACALGGAYVVLGCLILALPALDLGTLAPLFALAILSRGAAALAEARRLGRAPSRSATRRARRATGHTSAGP
jgi:uncharacterized membrane protein HdeD (DUF308 family)